MNRLLGNRQQGRLSDENLFHPGFLNSTIAQVKSYAHRIRRKLLSETSDSFWTRYNVTLHRSFKTAEESLAHFRWRNDQYIDYIKLMPVDGQDGKIVLDYGCGPGNDLVGFGIHSKPSRLIGMDISPKSLEQARTRLKLHDVSSELVLISETDHTLSLDDESVDYIHSSGVIHHINDPVHVLSEFKRILKKDGMIRIMIYNYDSIFLHLHVAFLSRIINGLYRNLPIREAFSRFTDGEECPIAHVYKPEEFISLAESVGLTCEFLGAAISVREMADLDMRWKAIMHPGLEDEHRHFLTNLRLNDRGLPLFKDMIAGHDGCYCLQHRVND